MAERALQEGASRAPGEGAPWRSILEGVERSKALAVVETIARDLSRVGTPRQGATLAGGCAGLALFHAYSALAIDSERDADRAVALLEQGARALVGERIGLGLYSGLLGLFWVVRHLRDRFLDPDEELGGVFTESVARYFDADNADRSLGNCFDLCGGLVGLGLCALDHLPAPTASVALDACIDRIGALAERTPQGLAWHTPASLLPKQESRDQYPLGLHNVGVAHGSPGIIGFLARVRDAGHPHGAVEPVVRGAVSWLLASELRGFRGSHFPWAFAPGMEPAPARSAWCYGNPGIAVVLLGAARSFDVPSWEAEAVRFAVEAAQRPPEEAGVRDASVCHGSAGLAHLMNRLYQATGDERFLGAARYWLADTMRRRQPGRGIAGFLSYGQNPAGAVGMLPDPGFLTGAAGIGLVLLAASTNVEPAWDRVLLADIAPRPTSE